MLRQLLSFAGRVLISAWIVFFGLDSAGVFPSESCV
jgi:hypothetical protein